MGIASLAHAMTRDPFILAAVVNTLRLRALLTLTAILSCVPETHAGEQAHGIVLTSCRFADLARAARCGSFSVP